MNKLVVIIIFALVFSGQVNAQRVGPYQAGSYYPGLINLRDLAAPPAGLIFVDYNYWFNTNGYYDKDGTEFKGGTIDLPLLNSSVDVTLEPKISGYTNVPFLFYASKFKILGGARYLASINPVYLNMNSDVFLAIGDTSGNISGNSSGFGDLSFMPLGLSWSFDNKYDIALMYTIYAPTGRFELGGDDNLGQGFWTHQIQIPTYFYVLEQATAFAIIPTFELNSKIEGTNARAGSRFSLEYGISQYFTSWLEVEIMNGHNWQISDDSGSDIWWYGTRFDSRDRKNSFSAGVGVWPVKDLLNLRFKYIIDYGIRQRFKNQFWSLSILVLPQILTGKSSNKK